MALLTAAKSNKFPNFPSLYNGNIGAMSTTLAQFGKQTMVYRNARAGYAPLAHQPSRTGEPATLLITRIG